MAKIRKPRWNRELYGNRLNRWLRFLAWKYYSVRSITLEELPD